MTRIENPVAYARSVKSAMNLARQVWDDQLTPVELGETVKIFVANFNPHLSPDSMENPRNLRRHPAHGVDSRSYMIAMGSVVSRGKRPANISVDESREIDERCSM